MRTTTVFALLLSVGLVAYMLSFRKPYSTAFSQGFRVGDTAVIQWQTNRSAIRLMAFDIGSETATFEIWEPGATNWVTNTLAAVTSNWRVAAAGTNLMWSMKAADEIYFYAGDPRREPKSQLPKIAFPVDPALAVRFAQGENIVFDWFIAAETQLPNASRRLVLPSSRIPENSAQILPPAGVTLWRC